MKPLHVLLIVATGAVSAGCANTERSRDLANPAVAATTLAQQVCSNCHGLTGHAVSPNFPNLAGQLAPYTTAQLKGFRAQSRHDPAGFEYMWGLSRSLTDAQIDGLAAYYAAQPPVAPTPVVDRKRLDAGKAIFDTGVAAKAVPACASCHGNQGQGLAAFPRLAGQHADYVVKQLLVFQRTDERPEGSIMKTVAHELSDQNVRDVAAYVQSLPGL